MKSFKDNKMEKKEQGGLENVLVGDNLKGGNLGISTNNNPAMGGESSTASGAMAGGLGKLLDNLKGLKNADSKGLKGGTTKRQRRGKLSKMMKQMKNKKSRKTRKNKLVKAKKNARSRK